MNTTMKNVFFPSVDDAKTLEDDAVLLKVIEAYCTSAKTKTDGKFM